MTMTLDRPQAHAHRFILAEYERGIVREVCKCGAVRFEASYPIHKADKDNPLRARVRELNETEGIESMTFEGVNIEELPPETMEKVEAQFKASLPPVPPKPKFAGQMGVYYRVNRPAIEADIAALGADAARERWNFGKKAWKNFNNPPKPRQNGRRAGRITATITKPDVKVDPFVPSLGFIPEVAPVPPRPDTTGMSQQQITRTMIPYYEANKPAILADFEKLGEAAMVERWKIPHTTWKVKRARWMPDRFKLPDWNCKKKTEAGKDAKNLLPVRTALSVDFGGGTGLVITERELADLTEYDFNQLWKCIGLVIYKRAKVG